MPSTSRSSEPSPSNIIASKRVLLCDETAQAHVATASTTRANVDVRSSHSALQLDLQRIDLQQLGPLYGRAPSQINQHTTATCSHARSTSTAGHHMARGSFSTSTRPHLRHRDSVAAGNDMTPPCGWSRRQRCSNVHTGP